jgi:UDP-2-acetamido-2,6-beta-L-arabino-hexul-4-ose reductase
MERAGIVVVTGADGFLGKNLTLRLKELGRFEIRPITRASTPEQWVEAVSGADAAVHLAGVNRPLDPAEFSGNATSAQQLLRAVEQSGRNLPIILSSSAKATDDSPYGASKRAAEQALLSFAERTGAPVAVFRLPNVFGKWCRPNYNSGVATFCHNIARDLPITVSDRAAPLTLVYVDDVVDAFIKLIDQSGFATGYHAVQPVYETTVGAVADTIRGFRADRDDNLIANVGTGLTRALYATYVSYLPPAEFSYQITSHRDPRGAFSEMLKTREAGQFSYFTAHPGVTRGGHYHHTKTEKFLIVHGDALFRFRHMLSGETHEVRTSGEVPVVVETVPGWTHDVTNVGDGVMVSLLWANELFDRERPDTIAEKV